MEAKELRIGNKLLHITTEKKYYETVKELRDGFINNYPSDERFEGIPLTEERLIKFGFKKKIQGILTYYELNNFRLFIMASKHDITKDCFMPGYFIHAFDTIELKFIHQLQNLYFALTGEELECQ